MTETNTATGVKMTQDAAGIWFYMPKTKAGYRHFKVTKGGWLCGYWNSGGGTKSGYYRDVLFDVGTRYFGLEVEKIDGHTAVIRRAELEKQNDQRHTADERGDCGITSN